MQVIIDGVEYLPMPDVPSDKSLLAALDVRFDSDAGENITIRDYFYTLLKTLWDEGEGFSGKRPFGNSGWEFDLYCPLIRDGFLSGSLTEDGYLDKYNQKEAGAYIFKLILAAFYGVKEADK